MPLKSFRNEKVASALSQKQYESINKYISSRYHDETVSAAPMQKLNYEKPAASYSAPMAEHSAPVPSGMKMQRARKKRKLEDVIFEAEENFQQMLFRLIDEKDLSDVAVYKQAHISRKLFSKIRSNADYKPSKNTCISFAIALNLPLDKALDLLGKAGYTLSDCSKFDLIIKYFIEEEDFDLFKINEALHAFNQPLLST